MPPTFAALHAPSPEAVPSTLPLTSSVAAALRSRGNRRASDIHPPPLGAFLPPIRDAPYLHGGVLPRAAPSPEAVPSSLRRRSSRFPSTSPTASPLQELPQGSKAAFSGRCGESVQSPSCVGELHQLAFSHLPLAAFYPLLQPLQHLLLSASLRQSARVCATAAHRPRGLSSPPIRGVSFTSRRSTKRRDGKVD